MANSSQTPFVEIIEQPSPKALRFRYECEGRMAGSLPGASSTADNKTYPAIKVHNYKGEAVVVVSCVTKDKPYRPHPHSLVGKEGCSKGVCTIRFSNDNMICTFPNLGIQCIKKKGIDEALRVRESLRVDPFNTGFSHRSKDIDLNVVRLCFQVFIEGNTPRKFNRPLEAVVSEPIYDKKAMCDLLISDLSQYAGPCSGGQRVFLLCEKIVKDDIQVKFCDDEGWEALAEFQHADVWKQVAIKFKTPPYKYHDRNGTVHIQLVRPSDGATSEPRQFHYYSVPEEISMEQRIRKHPRITNESHLTDFVDFNQGPMQLLQQGVNICVGDQIDERVIRHGARPTARVKKEPVDFMGGGEVEVNPFPASSYQPTINLNYPLISQPGPSTSPYQYHLGSPGAQYNMQQYAPSPEAKYNPTPSPQYNIAGSPPYPPIDSTYQPSVQFNINPGGQPQSESQNIDLGSLPSLSDSNLQVLEQFINVDNLSTSFSQNLSFTTEDEKKNNFDNASGSNKEQVSNDLDKGGSNVFRISAKDVPSGFSGLLSDDISATENYLRNDVNMKSFNQLSSKE